LFGQIDDFLQEYHDTLEQEYTLLLSVKEVLENEVQSHVIQKEMIQSDFTSLSENYEALKGAYHSLSYETATASNSQGNNNELQRKIETLKTQVTVQGKQLTEHQQTITKQTLELRSQGNTITALEEELHHLQSKEISLQITVKTQSEEMESLRILQEKYKQKLKELSATATTAAGTQKKDRDFFDTFEEVMQDEMMAMKVAFEKKLKAAKEEADAKSKLHQVEIQRMQQSLSNSGSVVSLKR